MSCHGLFFFPFLPFLSSFCARRAGTEWSDKIVSNMGVCLGPFLPQIPSVSVIQKCRYHPQPLLSFHIASCGSHLTLLRMYIQNGSTISIETFLPRPPHCIIVSCPLSSVLTVPLLGLRIRKIQATELPVLFSKKQEGHDM
ncbi:hypothetical protein CTAM01_00170 [Colletotrichum tamarilloi]|uniref:Secreted protein n=1 Tax=Colletotrichum tamarilloi TaxID=1209934 RepID=A0ABQ9RUF9_9PEZI|nr:uncharacterized protein CTAM01_00170 [Colletotrichum tamarilloi]KAK1512775.1 hypothetical protein CTAM01_00170 [Colletotrichum tamarilloi]